MINQLKMSTTLLLSLIITALIHASKANNFEFKKYVQCGKAQYFSSPLYPEFYIPGSNYKWTIQAKQKFKLSCFIDIYVPDVLVIGQSTAGRDVPYTGIVKFNATSKSNEITMSIKSDRDGKGGRFYCVAECVEQPRRSQKCSCGWRNPNRIVEGEETQIHEFPMMAGLVHTGRKVSNFRDVECGATIINSRQVITAAHCFHNQQLKFLKIMIGGHDLHPGKETRETQMLNIKRIRIHEKYNLQDALSDIAIVDVEGDIKFTSNIGPVCLPFNQREYIFDSEKLTILGWGTVGLSEERSPVLLKTNITAISDSECLKQIQKPNIDQICTLDELNDSCQGDSGGPLLWYNTEVRRLFLVGIISNGGMCGDNRIAFNTRVTSYLSWIEQNKPDGFNYCKL